MKTLFISRKLKVDSEFWNFQKLGYRIFDESLLTLTPIQIETWPPADWLFFYSPNAIRFYFQQQKLQASQKYGVMSEASARVFLQITGKHPDFTGNSNAIDISRALNKLCDGQRLLIPKAKNSLHALQSHLGESLKMESIDLYDNQINVQSEIPACDILVFTSPMNVEAYYHVHGYTGQPTFCIGSSTAKRFKSITGHEAYYCNEPGERALYNLVISYLANL